MKPNGKKSSKQQKAEWSSASDRIRMALEKLEQDTDAGLLRLRTKVEDMEAGARAVGEIARVAARRG